MTERRGDTLLFHTSPVIAAQAAVGGKKESEGPLAAGFDELPLPYFLQMDRSHILQALL